LRHYATRCRIESVIAITHRATDRTHSGCKGSGHSSVESRSWFRHFSHISTGLSERQNATMLVAIRFQTPTQADFDAPLRAVKLQGEFVSQQRVGPERYSNPVRDSDYPHQCGSDTCVLRTMRDNPGEPSRMRSAIQPPAGNWHHGATGRSSRGNQCRCAGSKLHPDW
jgi:hypothetical protein